MKTFKVKNYKGNLVESLSKFQESHKGMKIVQAYANEGNLKILAEELENVNEASSSSVFAVMIHDDDKFKTILGIGSSEKEAQKIIDNAKGWEHAKGNMKIVKLDLNKEIDYSLYGLDFSESKSVVKEAESDKNEYHSYIVYYKLFDDKDKVLYLRARSSKDAIFSAIDTIKVRNNFKTRDDVFEILQSIEVKK